MHGSIHAFHFLSSGPMLPCRESWWSAHTFHTFHHEYDVSYPGVGWSVGWSVGRSSISCEHSSRSTNSGALGQNTSLAGEGKLERRQHLRVHGVLRVPSMALQRPYSRVAVELGEVYELLDCRLLLSAVDCRHRVLAPRIRPRVQTPSVCCCGVERRVGRAECAVLGTRPIVN